MTTLNKYRFLTIFIAAVWITSGLFCKVLNLVPRHQQIVAGILGEEHSRAITLLIGIAELAMAAWVLSGISSRFNAIVQITIIAVMNILEFLMVPELLLWERANAIFAAGLIALIYYNEFHLHKLARSNA
jgi:uncharacterized membrane protein YphA (DoxX/SURF4 family)